MSALLSHHAEMLAESAIGGAVARERGYRSVEQRVQLGELGFKSVQRLVPALLLPIHNVHGEIVNYQARPDTPRICEKRGKPIKYETIAGSRMALDVPPRCRVDLANPERVLWITEGVRKADALTSAGECAIALLGVWNWRGTNDKGGKTALADWEAIALNARRVFLTFDSDAMEKQGVHAALERLARFLKSKGALVKIVYLPNAADAEKVGVDDYLAAGGTIKDLVGLAEDGLRPLPEPERRAPEPTARLLAYVMGLIRRHVHLPGEHEMVALALYALHTYALAEAHVTPYMLITSPAKRSGKTRLLETLELVVREPLRAASVTPAAMYQAIDRWRPTLMIDEIDAIFSGSRASERTEELRGVLNAGNARGSFVVRGTQDGEPAKFSIFCAKLLAGIDNGKLPDTIRDRCIVIALERKRRDQQVDRLRPADLLADTTLLQGMLDDWGHAHAAELAEQRPDPIMEIGDRLDEAWEPLRAIAELAGGDWPERARAAAVALAGKTEDDGQDLGLILLAALRGLLGDAQAISSKAICASLNEDDEGPFGGMRAGAGIDARGLSRLLRPYQIKPRTVGSGPDSAKGYRREQFAEVWERYLPERARNDDPPVDPSQASQASHPMPHAERDATDATDATDEVQPPSRACVNGNGGPPRTLLEEFGSQDGIVNAIVETFDGSEIAEPEVRYLTTAETAAWLEVSPQEFASLRAKGKIRPVVDAGGGKRGGWRTADLRALRPDADLPGHPDLLSDRERERADRYRDAWPWLAADDEVAR